MSLDLLVAAAEAHARAIDAAERALKQAQEALEAADEAGRRAARLAVGEVLPLSWPGDWISAFGAKQIEQLIGRFKSSSLRRDSANFRAGVATESERARGRARNRGKPA